MAAPLHFEAAAACSSASSPAGHGSGYGSSSSSSSLAALAAAAGSSSGGGSSLACISKDLLLEILGSDDLLVSCVSGQPAPCSLKQPSLLKW